MQKRLGQSRWALGRASRALDLPSEQVSGQPLQICQSDLCQQTCTRGLRNWADAQTSNTRLQNSHGKSAMCTRMHTPTLASDKQLLLSSNGDHNSGTAR